MRGVSKQFSMQNLFEDFQATIQLSVQLSTVSAKFFSFIIIAISLYKSFSHAEKIVNQLLIVN